MFVCHCRAVTDRTIAACVAGGARTLDEVAERCGAGGRCGGCRPVVAELLGDGTALSLDSRAARRSAA